RQPAAGREARVPTAHHCTAPAEGHGQSPLATRRMTPGGGRSGRAGPPPSARGVTREDEEPSGPRSATAVTGLPEEEAVAACLARELSWRPLPVPEATPREWEQRVTQSALESMRLGRRCEGVASRAVLRGVYREALGTPEPADVRYRQGCVRYIRVG